MNNRGRRSSQYANKKQFVSGGVFDTNSPLKPQNQNWHQGHNKPQAAPKIEPEPIEEVVPVEDTPMVEAGTENPFKEGNGILDASDLVDANGKVKFKKIFMTRKKPSVRAKAKRIRVNRHLRKTIVPKNALMALHELKGVSIGEFTIDNNPNGGFTALVTVNNTQYEGKGNSKVASKNNACEKALRDFILAKMRQNPRLKRSNSSEPMETENNDTTLNPVTSENIEAVDEAEEVPMINLASFAIYKLFSEWENGGFIIPEMHPSTAANASDNEGSIAGGVKEPKKAPIRTELPENWESMHPASLLCVMRPGINYLDKGAIGEKPNVLQQLGVVVDDQDYVATGRSKKLARRNVAALACNSVFNTNFSLDVTTETP